MSQSLDEFVAEAKEAVEKFAAHYLSMNKKNPEHYPLVLDDDNKGLWWTWLMDSDE